MVYGKEALDFEYVRYMNLVKLVMSTLVLHMHAVSLSHGRDWFSLLIAQA